MLLSATNFSSLTACIWGTSPSKVWETSPSNPDFTCYVKVKWNSWPALDLIKSVSPSVPLITCLCTHLIHLLSCQIFFQCFLWWLFLIFLPPFSPFHQVTALFPLGIFTLTSVPNTNSATVFIRLPIYVFKNFSFLPNQHPSFSFAPFQDHFDWNGDLRLSSVSAIFFFDCVEQ